MKVETVPETEPRHGSQGPVGFEEDLETRRVCHRHETSQPHFTREDTLK